MNIEVAVNASWNDFFINLHIAEVEISNTTILVDTVGLFARDYDVLFTNLLNMQFS